jgi:hypothetical protein
MTGIYPEWGMVKGASGTHVAVRQSSTEAVDNFVGKCLQHLAKPRKITGLYKLLHF